MKIWVDDLRPAPEGYRWVKSVDEATKVLIQHLRPMDKRFCGIEVLDMDHDAGDWAYCGGDFIKLIYWLERGVYEHGWIVDFPFRLHSMNPVGVENMRRIIKRNGWTEVR